MTCRPDSSHHVDVHLGDGLFTALEERCRRTGESASHVIRQALADALDLDHHTIYQVSTSGALVQGVYQGCVRVGDLLQHGDFGLGTFEGLDGEGILLDGTCWQACADGTVRQAPADALAPSYARTINVPGYHLHLLSDDHRHAGHVQELQSRELQLELHRESHLQLVLPETPAFLKADLSGDPAAALAKAEGDHR
jgi:alpha-acetolactate decarboxylase